MQTEDPGKIKPEWIDRIFLRMEQKFGDKWKQRFSNREKEEIAKTQWQSALYKCTSKEIQRALLACDRLGNPPTVVEFYHLAKSLEFAPKPREKIVRTPEQTEKGREQISLIKKSLHY